MGVVEELVFADLADGEITCLGMGEHEAGNTGVRLHGTALREADVNLFHA